MLRGRPGGGDNIWQHHILLFDVSGLDSARTMTDHKHGSHPAIVKRLNRATGHLRAIADMIEAGRPCTDVAQQLHAVEKAICNAKKQLINDHIDRCLLDAQATKGSRSAVDEFRAISKYL